MYISTNESKKGKVVIILTTASFSSKSFTFAQGKTNFWKTNIENARNKNRSRFKPLYIQIKIWLNRL